MKKTLLALFVFVGFIGESALAQNFTLPSMSSNDTIAKSINPGLDKIYNKIRNVSSSPITVTWKVLAHDLPADWSNTTDAEFGVCDNLQCYYNTNNAILGGTANNTLAIAPGGESDFHVQINLDNASTGTHYIKFNYTDGTQTEDAVFLITKTPTNVSTITRTDDEIVIYPNPAKDFVNVLFNANAGVKTIAVHNMIGKLVNIYKVSANSARLETAELPAGVYFIRLQDAQGRVVGTRKFTRQ